MKRYKLLTLLLALFLIQCSQVKEGESNTSETQAVTPPVTAAADSGVSDSLEWNTIAKFSIPAEPVDIAHTLDGKMVYILGNDNTVYIIAADGAVKGQIPVSSGISTIDISPYGDTLFLADKETKTFQAMTVDFTVNIPVGTSPFVGPENAPVTMLLFTDFECPYCKQIPAILDKVMEKNKGKVRLVLKNLPLRIHKNAEPAARAALAAREQGKFWEFHDELFAQKQLNQTVINGIAIKLGLDMEKFNTDMLSAKVTKQLQSDIQQASENGISGTPTVYINGRKPKSRSLAGFQKLIDEEYAKKSK